MAYYIYLIGAVICFSAELFTLDFSLACIGAGMLGAGAASWMGLTLGWQAIVFIVLSLALFMGIRPLALKHLYHKDPDVKTNIEALIGRQALVETAPDESGLGRVQIDGDSWRAQFTAPVPQGAAVRVEKLDGVTLTVTPEKQTEEKK